MREVEDEPNVWAIVSRMEESCFSNLYQWTSGVSFEIEGHGILTSSLSSVSITVRPMQPDVKIKVRLLVLTLAVVMFLGMRVIVLYTRGYCLKGKKP